MKKNHFYILGGILIFLFSRKLFAGPPKKTTMPPPPKKEGGAMPIKPGVIVPGSHHVPTLKPWRITSGFGPRKTSSKKMSSIHNGIDIAVKIGTDLFATFDGKVVARFYKEKGGNQLVIANDDGSRSGYAHLNEFLVNIGDRVKKGQLVAKSGNTGFSTGPHLHFTFKNTDGKAIDPVKIFGK